MRHRTGLPAKKYGPYVQEHLIKAFDAACGGKHSEGVPVAMLILITLIRRRALSVEAYADLVDLTNDPDLARAVNRTWATLLDSARDAILLGYAKELPDDQQKRIIQKTVQRGAK
jgi:hypothetical protein